MNTFRGFNGASPKGSLLHNDDSHNFRDLNGGGGPHGIRNKPSVAPHGRGGFGAQGQRALPKPSGATHPTAGNPAKRGGTNAEARGRGAGVASESRIPNHGGSPQHREREIPGDFHKRGGVGAMGQESVPGGRADAVYTPSSGSTGGRSYRLIAGRFKRAAMGARGGGNESRGSYGGSPVSSNT